MGLQIGDVVLFKNRACLPEGEIDVVRDNWGDSDNFITNNGYLVTRKDVYVLSGQDCDIDRKIRRQLEFHFSFYENGNIRIPSSMRVMIWRSFGLYDKTPEPKAGDNVQILASDFTYVCRVDEDPTCGWCINGFGDLIFDNFRYIKVVTKSREETCQKLLSSPDPIEEYIKMVKEVGFEKMFMEN